MLLLGTDQKNNALPAMRPVYGAQASSRFLCAEGFATPTLAPMSDSLVRVSRRVGPLRRPARSWPECSSRGSRARRVDPRSRARPATAASEDKSGAPAGGAGTDRASAGGREAPVGRDRAVRLLPTISRTISPSFQSSFHLSLTVLVRYRSRARI